MEKDWVMVFSTVQMYEIAIIKHMLQDNDIMFIDINKQDAAYRFGEIELFVKQKDVIMAKRLIDTFLNESSK